MVTNKTRGLTKQRRDWHSILPMLILENVATALNQVKT